MSSGLRYGTDQELFALTLAMQLRARARERENETETERQNHIRKIFITSF